MIRFVYMKRVLYILVIVISVSILFASDNLISYFNASSNGSRIKVEWRSSDESSIQKYALERACKNGSFSKLSELDAKGYASAYTYNDENALKETLSKDDNIQSATLYTYRIKIISKDQSVSYSNSINVSHSTSGVKRTWGMIKEMFK